MSGRVVDSAQRWLQRTHAVSATKHRYTVITCHRRLNSAHNVSTAHYFKAPVGWFRLDGTLLLGKHTLFIPAKDFKHLASMIVRIQDFRFGLRC